MSKILDAFFLIGAVGVAGKYIGIEFLKEHSLWFSMLFICAGITRSITTSLMAKNKGNF